MGLAAGNHRNHSEGFVVVAHIEMLVGLVEGRGIPVALTTDRYLLAAAAVVVGRHRNQYSPGH